MKNKTKKNKKSSQKISTTKAYSIEGDSFLTAIQKDGKIYKRLVNSKQTKSYPSNALDPPYSPELLYGIFENSSLLLPNIAAYEANIDSMGFRFTGKVDLTKQDINDHIKDALWEDKIILGADNPEINEKEIEQQLKELKRKQKIEIVKAKAFFNNCTKRKSFLNLKKITRRDLEVCGNAYWEVMRDADNEIQYFKRIPPAYVRITALSKENRRIKNYRSISSLTVEDQILEMKTRSYIVQIGNGFRYFKTFNCLDEISSKKGIYFSDKSEYEKNNDRNQLGDTGNEIIHFSLEENLSEPYGVPRWIGVMPDILGSRNVSLYNYSWFNEGISSPMAVLVSGGALTDKSVSRIRSVLSGAKGVKNSHKLLILEATSGDVDQKDLPSIELKPLESMDDMKWSEYDEKNDQKVGNQFRISDIVRGSTKGTYNRATAEAALTQSDMQVFAPIRTESDYFINKIIMPELGFKNIKFVSNGFSITDIEKLGKLIVEFVKESVLTISEARTIAEKVFKVEFAPIEGNWGDYPLDFFVNGLITLSENINSEENELTEDELESEVNDLLSKARRLGVKLQGSYENFKE